MKRLVFITTIMVLALGVTLGVTQAKAGDWRDYFTWEASIFVSDGVESPSPKLKVGASEDATEGYDRAYEKDARFGGAIRTYFHRPEWGRGAIGDTDYYWYDIRSTELPQAWTFKVEANRIGDITLDWNTDHVVSDGCSSIELVLTDNTTGQSVVMTDPANSSFVYYSSSVSPRSFSVNASASAVSDGLAPTGFRANPGAGQLILHWDFDSTVAGYKVYRDGVLVSGDALIVDADGDGTGVFVDKNTAKGRATAVSHSYSISSVAKGDAGCESDQSSVQVSR